MNLILLSRDELASGPRVELRDRRAAHLRTVLRAQPGDTVSVGELDGRMGSATVLALDAASAHLEVALDHEPPPPLGVELLLALPRPKILRKVLQAAASMGCKRIALVGSYRVEKSYWDSPVLAPDSVREELLLGLEQGRDTRLPEVTRHRYFKPFAEDQLEGLFAGHTRLLPHPRAAGPLPPVSAAPPAVLAIGPEGGWTEYEAGQLEARGFQPYRAGARILRVDVAVPFLVGQVALRRQ